MSERSFEPMKFAIRRNTVFLDNGRFEAENFFQNIYAVVV